MVLSGGGAPPKKILNLSSGPYSLETLKELKENEVNHKTVEDFFDEQMTGFVTRFGIQCLFRTRLGYCGFTNVRI